MKRIKVIYYTFATLASVCLASGLLVLPGGDGNDGAF